MGGRVLDFAEGVGHSPLLDALSEKALRQLHSECPLVCVKDKPDTSEIASFMLQRLCIQFALLG